MKDDKPQDGTAQPAVPVAEHSDNEKSLLPERDDADKKRAPNDNPPETSTEKEPPVG
ncbi:hypothetical protein [Chitinasiproducens palmae]|uniref:Uncharacterized protein n=1 Tax=Chitinasiproducens palmae TaxID=1770053 RepID=A0A1H2PT91_9BURK|nr:hypothetical protein [Chitinasiproducens palmae]SDV49877.1 hypothetical protein SAMN05216551_109210 [Chitinasiproducens palmae]